MASSFLSYTAKHGYQNFFSQEQKNTFDSLDSEVKRKIESRFTSCRDISDLDFITDILDLLKACSQMTAAKNFFVKILTPDWQDETSAKKIERSLKKVKKIILKGNGEAFFDYLNTKKIEKQSHHKLFELTTQFYQNTKTVSSTTPVSNPKEQILESNSLVQLIQCLKPTDSWIGLEPFFDEINQATFLDNSETLEFAKFISSLSNHEFNPHRAKTLLSSIQQFKELWGSDALSMICSTSSLQGVETVETFQKMVHLLIATQASDEAMELLLQYTGQEINLQSFLKRVREEIAKKGVEHSFFQEDIRERINRFAGNDPTVSYPLSQPEINLIERQYDQFRSYCCQYQYETIPLLSERAQNLRQEALHRSLNEDELLQLVAIGWLAIRQEFGISPYSTQILALLGMLAGDTSKLAQIKTGEGKSIIIALLAFTQAMQARAVDIVSSNRYLSVRDQKRFAPFFNHFNIETSHICDDHPSKKQFHAQILYGTVYDFEFAWMRDRIWHKGYYAERLKHPFVKRNFDCIIVDEADNLLIDLANNMARIASEADESYEWIYVPLLKFTMKFPSQPFSAKEVRNYLLREGVDQQRLDLLSDSQLANWISSAKTALFQHQNLNDYVVRTVSDKMSGREKESVQIVESKHSGRISSNTRYHNGLHEFIEAKHDVEVAKESLTPLSISHAYFYSFYSKIFALTGTGGPEADRKEIEEIFGMGRFDVPPHKLSIRVDYPPEIFDSDEAYLNEIINEAKACQDKGRPLLILAKTIEESQEIHELLKRKGFKANLLNEVQDQSEEEILSQAGLPGSITVATNVAGRGTDILLSQESLKNGGLHVLLTFYPDSDRVRDQNVGRAGRNGEPGSSRIILSFERLKNTLDSDLQIVFTTLPSQNRLQFYADYRNFSEALLREQRIHRARLEQIASEIIEEFLKKWEIWFQTCLDDRLIQRHAERLSTIKLFKLVPFDFTSLHIKDRKIAATCMSLLTSSQINVHSWKTFLKEALKRTSDKALSNWAQQVYMPLEAEIQQLQLLSLSAEEERARLSELFTKARPCWEKYLDSEKGLFLFLEELTKIDLSPL